MWHKFERVADNPKTHPDLSMRVWCTSPPNYSLAHRVELRDAIADVAVRPYAYYCMACAKELGYVEEK